MRSFIPSRVQHDHVGGPRNLVFGEGLSRDNYRRLDAPLPELDGGLFVVEVA
jgi:hypothetical protein